MDLISKQATDDVPDTNVGDCISRQAAIETVKESFECGWYLMETISHFEELPTIEERKKGKWFLDHNGQFRCSNCDRVPVNRIIIDATLVYDVPAIKEYMRYCPICGARME